MTEIRGKELGIEGCTYTAHGETAGDLLKDMLAHLRKEHHLDMPSAEELLGIEVRPKKAIDFHRAAAVDAHLPPDEEVSLVTRRLMERLDLNGPSQGQTRN